MSKAELFWLTGKYKPKKKRVSSDEKESPKKEVTESAKLHIEAIRAAIYLKIKNREGRNKLMENYLTRLESLIGAENANT